MLYEQIQRKALEYERLRRRRKREAERHSKGLDSGPFPSTQPDPETAPEVLHGPTEDHK